MMRKKRLLKTGILAASFAAMVPMTAMDAFAAEAEETAVVAEADAEVETETEAETEAEAAEAEEGEIREEEAA